jgi:hypothetical protein
MPAGWTSRVAVTANRSITAFQRDAVAPSGVLSSTTMTRTAGASNSRGLAFSLSPKPSFDPLTLFAASEQGAWYDPSDITTLFQDTAGTVPVTAAGQSVALMLDKSGRGNHATQANLAQRPLYQIDGTGRPFLLFDGSDDGMATGNIAPGTDKAQVFAGVRKLSDAAVGVVAEMSANFAINSGTFSLSDPSSAANQRPAFASRGTASSAAIGGSAIPAPITNVLTGICDIAADTSILRVNGVQNASSATDQGTGNFLTYPLFIGRRGGTASPFNGRMYGLLVRFGANLTADQITQTETWLNQRAGAF